MKKFFVIALTISMVFGLLVVYSSAQEKTSDTMCGIKDEVKDPVCGMKLKLSEAKFKSNYKDNNYYFCSADCKAKFDKKPEKFAKKETPLNMFCCKLDENLTKDVNIEKKKTENGIIIIVTSSNPEVIKKLQKSGEECKNELMHKEHSKHIHKEHAEHEKECCLMHMKDVKSTFSNIENGIKIEFTSENQEVLKNLKMSHKECSQHHKSK